MLYLSLDLGALSVGPQPLRVTQIALNSQTPRATSRVAALQAGQIARNG
jgi:hypothetical protein